MTAERRPQHEFTKEELLRDHRFFAEYILSGADNPGEISEIADGILQEQNEWTNNVLADIEGNYNEGEYEQRTHQESDEAKYHIAAGRIATLDGDTQGFNHLAARLITEPKNAKMGIIDFLGVYTDGTIGEQEPPVPTKEYTVRIVKQIQEAYPSTTQ